MKDQSYKFLIARKTFFKTEGLFVLLMQSTLLNNVYVICGPPGAGKTTLGTWLARRKHCCLVDIDACTERLVRVGLALSGHDINDRDGAFFKQNFREPVYETLFDIAASQPSGSDIVIVGPFTKELRNPSWVDWLRLRLSCASVRVLFVRCSPERQLERLKNRGNIRDTGKIENWEEYIAYFDRTPPACPHIEIENNNDKNNIEEWFASLPEL